MRSWRAVWWNLGKLALGHVGIIFILFALFHVSSTLLRFNLGNSVGVFYFDLTFDLLKVICSSNTGVFRLFFFLPNFFPQISVCRICKLYNLFFFHTNRIIDYIYNIICQLFVDKLYIYIIRSKSCLPRLSLHTATHISKNQPQIHCAAHVSSYTNIQTITYSTTHNNTQIYSAHTYTHLHKELYKTLTSFWLFRFFSISLISVFLCLMIVVIRRHETSGCR